MPHQLSDSIPALPHCLPLSPPLSDCSLRCNLSGHTVGCRICSVRLSEEQKTFYRRWFSNLSCRQDLCQRLSPIPFLPCRIVCLYLLRFRIVLSDFLRCQINTALLDLEGKIELLEDLEKRLHRSMGRIVKREGYPNVQSFQKVYNKAEELTAHFFKYCFLHNRFHLSYRSLSIDFFLTDRFGCCLPSCW